MDIKAILGTIISIQQVNADANADADVDAVILFQSNLITKVIPWLRFNGVQKRDSKENFAPTDCVPMPMCIFVLSA